MSLVSIHDRLSFFELHPTRSSPSFCEVVQTGLRKSQKSLPSRYFYDSAGSHLFEQITELPEYYLTNIELRILEREALPILGAVGNDAAIIEFGSGSSKKTRVLIETAFARQDDLLYVPIDISRDFLHESSRELLDRYPQLRVHALAAEYSDAIDNIPEHDGPRLILFLGSNIGNFQNDEAVQFLASIARNMKPIDRLLVGADLVKEPSTIERAYNDDRGVTALFNKNILRRVNRELDGDFDLDAFVHSAPYLREEQRVEMHLVSQRDQVVEIDAIGEVFVFDKGEHILTEYCQKYTDDSLNQLGASAGLETVGRWHDPEHWFSLVLMAPRAT